MEAADVMVISSATFGLPMLEENPFNPMPLEAGDERKLIARDAEFLELKNYLKYQSPRRILLVGSFGSGRTSLLRCLQPYASTYASVEHLRAQGPGDALLRDLHAQLVGTQAPMHHADLVKSLVDACFGFANGLPLIVIDVPASDTSVLNVALRDSLAVLERLRALVVLVCEPHERRQLPPNVAGLFDEIRLASFGAQEVVNLVEHRLSTLGVSSLTFTTMNAEALLARCDGSPLAVLTLLRNAVDAVRMGSGTPVPSTTNIGQSKILPRDEPYALGVLSGSEHPPVPNAAQTDIPARELFVGTEHEMTDAPLQDLASTPSHAALQTGAVTNPSGVDIAAGPDQGFASEDGSIHDGQDAHPSAAHGGPLGVVESTDDGMSDIGQASDGAYPSTLLDPLDPVIFDASMPWTQRVEVETAPPSAPANTGFELDFDGLRRAQAEDDPLPPLPGPTFGSGIIDASSVAPLPKGMFSKLAERNRFAKQQSNGFVPTAQPEGPPLESILPPSQPSLEDDVGAWALEGLVRETGDEIGEFWVAPGSLYEPPALDMEDDEPEDGGLNATPLEVVQHPRLSQGVVPVPPVVDHQATGAFSGLELTSSEVSADRLDEVHAMLSSLVMALKPEQTTSLLSYFQERQRPSRGPKDVHPLNHIALNQLNLREAYVVEQARLRLISPSDEAVLAHLGVQRSRLSQICNRLLRFGILEAQREGRFRKYQLTKAAEAQLIAWGALEEVVA